jgi:hypothetical protein
MGTSFPVEKVFLRRLNKNPGLMRFYLVSLNLDWPMAGLRIVQ